MATSALATVFCRRGTDRPTCLLRDETPGGGGVVDDQDAAVDNAIDLPQRGAEARGCAESIGGEAEEVEGAGVGVGVEDSLPVGHG